jgi:hypothetical protein
MRTNLFKKNNLPLLGRGLGGGLLPLLLLFAAGCSKDEEAAKFNIVEFPFGYIVADRPSPDQVREALANGADSVYLISQEDWYRLEGVAYLNVAASDAEKLTNIDPRVSGNNTIINPPLVMDQEVNPGVIDDFTAAGFRVIPGYRRE